MSDLVRQLVEKDRIIDTINQLFIATDNRDWAAVRGCLADQVLLDMTSLAGGRATKMAGEQVAAVWEEGLRSIESVHHQAGNYRVEVQDEEATAFCYGMASHFRRNRTGRNSRVFVGSYDLHLVRIEDRWLIDSFRFNLKFLEGNADLDRND
jgi:hypothetical protein